MPPRKKLVYTSAFLLFGSGISGFTHFGLFLTFITWGTAFSLLVWDNQTDKLEKQQAKRDFIETFDKTSLCTSIQNLTVVYKLIEQNEETCTVELIWSGDKPKLDAEIRKLPSNTIMPFDIELFINLT